MIIDRRLRAGVLIPLGFGILVASGCATLSDDQGRSSVDAMTAERGVEATAKGTISVVQALDTLMEKPVTAHTAAQIALLASPEVQAIYARLGYGAADLYEASRVSNPVFSGALLDSSARGEQDQLTLGLVQSITDLLTLRSRTRVSRQAFAALQASVAAQILARITHVQARQIAYARADQIHRMRQQIARAAQLSYQLAQRFHDAGNLPPRALAMEAANASQAQLAALEAELDALAGRQELASAMGVSSGDGWRVAGLDAVPKSTEDSLVSRLNAAQNTRLDLVAAKAEVESLAQTLDLEGWSRWLTALDAGWEYERETDGVRLRGPVVDWEIPLFNQGRDRVLRARADLTIALENLRQMQIEMENDVRLAMAAEDNARTRLEEIRERLIPARTHVVERGQEEVNFMLLGVFELIALKQEQYAAFEAYLHAVADYWTARIQAAEAVGRALPPNAAGTTVDVNALLTPPSSDPHAGHNMQEMSLPMPTGAEPAHGDNGDNDSSHTHSHHDGDHP